MPETGSAATGVDAASAAPAPGTGPESAAGEPPAQAVAAETIDALPEPWQREIRKLRRENAEARKALQAHEDANRSELERASGERDRLAAALAGREQLLRAVTARYEVARAAAKLGADPEVLYRYVRDDLKFDEETGEITNLPRALEAARNAAPALFPQAGPLVGRADAGAAAAAPDSLDMNAFLRRQRRR
ncbi:MAG: hypothetical protein ACKOWF_09335 [Chloroflexota bacterium]